MDTGTDLHTTDQKTETSSDDKNDGSHQGSEDTAQNAENKKESRLKIATVLILCLFNLTYYMDRFGIAGISCWTRLF